jgi:hypothetical protein
MARESVADMVTGLEGPGRGECLGQPLSSGQPGFNCHPGILRTSYLWTFLRGNRSPSRLDRATLRRPSVCHVLLCIQKLVGMRCVPLVERKIVRCSSCGLIRASRTPSFLHRRGKHPELEVPDLCRVAPVLPFTKPVSFRDGKSKSLFRFMRLILLSKLAGAGGGTRTHTTLPSRDFKSLASTSSATSALVARSEA